MMTRILTYIMFVLMVGSSVSAQSPPQDVRTKLLPQENPEYLRAQMLEVEGQYDEAKEIYKRLYESDRTDNTFWKLIMLYESTDDFRGMELLVLERLEEKPDDISLKRYLARAYYGQNDKEKGRGTLLNIIGNRWEDLGRIYLAASELMSQNDYDTALEVYSRTRAKVGRKDLFANEMAHIYSVRMEYSKALEEYLSLLDVVKITYTNAEQMIKNAIESGEKPDDISRPIIRYLDSHPKSIQAARLLSRLKYDAGDFEGAYRVLVPVAVASENPHDVWNLAERYKNEGRTDEAIRAYSDFYKYFVKDPRRISSLLELASIKTAHGDTLGALNDYQRLVENYKGTEEGDIAALRAIQLSVAMMDSDAFIRTLGNFAVSTQYRTVARTAYLIQGETFLRRGRAEEARQAFEQARIKSRSKEELYEVAVSCVLLGFYSGDYTSMSQEIDTCIKNNPGGDEINDLLSLKVLSMRCSSGSSLNDFNTYAAGKYSLYKGETDAGIDSLIAAAQDTASIVSPFAALELAQVFIRRGDTGKAVTWYLYAAKTTRDTTLHAGALMKAADILALNPANKERAAALYREALTANPGSVHESELRRKMMRLVTK